MRGFATLGVLLSVLGLCSAAPLQLVRLSEGVMSSGSSPSFCHDLDCPRFTVVNKTNDYEVRQYEQSQWARTVVESSNYTTAVEIGFHRLFSYISGRNVDHKKIPMTAPVTVQVVPGAGPYCNSSFTTSFMVPFAVQPTPPQPESSDVYIESEAEHLAFVTSFPGFATESDNIENAQKLAEALSNDGISFNSTVFYTAGYDSPYRLFNRHNEVWFYPSHAE